MDESAGHIAPDSAHESGTPAAWNERYSTRGMVWGKGPNQFVAEFAADLEPCRVLDLGCGQGRNAVWLAGRGHKVTGVDLSEVGIADARAWAAEAGARATFLVADAAEDWTPPAGGFDLVLLSYLQLPAERRRTVHAKAARALAPGGRVFLIAHHSDNIAHGAGGPPYPEVLFNESDLAADFAGLEILRNEKVFRAVEGEDGSVRDAHDILFVGRKPA